MELNISIVVGFIVWFIIGIALVLVHHYRSKK